MNRYSLPLLLIIPILFSNPALASSTNSGPYLSLTGGYYQFDSSQNLDDDYIRTLRIGYEFRNHERSKSLATEIAASFTGKGEGESYNLRLECLYPLFKGQAWTPHLALGAGALISEKNNSTEKNLIVGYGLGAHYRLKKYLALRADVRHLMVVKQGHQNNYEYLLGLTYFFGMPGEKKKPPSPDADRDGVPDQADHCPQTPTDLQVDKFGCPVDPPDTDIDHVPDYLDKCPGTSPGNEVDEDGCLPDSDGVGIPNTADICPRTPQTIPVDSTGCAKWK